MAEKEILGEVKAVSEPNNGDRRNHPSETGYVIENPKRAKRIRARASYRLFAELHDFLASKPAAADILVKLYDVLDARRSFGSVRNAEYAAESLALVLKDRDSTSEKILGNFYLGESFADVRCLFGHEVRLFNVGRGHFYACDTCRTYIFVGSNLMSRWREENDDIWRENSDSVKGYQFIERGRIDV